MSDITERIQEGLSYSMPRPAAQRRRLSGPFWLRRPFLVLRDLVTSRDRPNLERLAAIDDPESFVWSVLPHAARTFSACIALLPARSALPAAVAYLYCRMLDTYEDLVSEPAARDESLRMFSERLALAEAGGTLAPAPAIAEPMDRDDRDRAHLLLVSRAHLVDRVFLGLEPATRAVVRDLVRDMSEGMRWSSSTFAANGGVLTGEEQIGRYCRNVLGNPVVFSVRLLRLHHGLSPELSPSEIEDAMRVGELVQVANITRDVEKDLRRGVAYDDSLREFLGREPRDVDDRRIAVRCREVRERLSRFAFQRAPSYARVIESLHLPAISVARASAVLMLLFTERYFRSLTRRIGHEPWDGPDSTFVLMSRAFLATVSRRSAKREFSRVERALLLQSAR